MPVPQWMLEDLDRAGYRPITIKSYQDFIGGCRYVSIETGTGEREAKAGNRAGDRKADVFVR
jgi:hypothetical protein